jgi:WD40 repeat protein
MKSLNLTKLVLSNLTLNEICQLKSEFRNKDLLIIAIHLKEDKKIQFITAGSTEDIYIWYSGVRYKNIIGKHYDYITYIIYLGSDCIASCGYDKTIRVWNIQTGVMLKNLYGHTAAVDILAKVNDTLIASSAQDKAIKIWNFFTGHCLRTICNDYGDVKSMYVWGEVELITSDSNSIRVWNIRDGVCKTNISVDNLGHMGYFRDDIVMTCDSVEFSISFWNISKSERFMKLPGHTATVTSVIRLTDKEIASGSEDHTIKIWSVYGVHLKTLSGHAGFINCMTMVSKDIIASSSNDNTIRYWNIATGELMYTLPAHHDNIPIICKADDMEIVSCSHDCTIRLWKYNELDLYKILKGHEAKITALSRLSNNLIASGSWDMNIKIWDLKKMKCIRTIEGHSDMIRIILPLGGDRIASASYGYTILVSNIRTGKAVATIKGQSDEILDMILINPTTLAFASDDGMMRVWNYEENMITHSFDEGIIDSLCRISDFTFISLLRGGMLVKFFDIEKGECTRVINLSFQPVKMLRIGEDVIICSEEFIKVYTLATFEIFREYDYLPSESVDCVISRDKMIISCCKKTSTIYVRDIVKGNCNTLEVFPSSLIIK